MALKSYHLAWLRAHPHRDEAWLCIRLADGFDVHHLDGDKGNERADNLVLIEHTDHMRLHGMTNSARIRRVQGGGGRPKGAMVATVLKSEQAYRLRAQGQTWAEIAPSIGVKRPRYAMVLAKQAAKANGWRWPLWQ